MSDHFDAALEDGEQNHHTHPDSGGGDDDEYVDHEEVPKKGWRPSTGMVIALAAAVSMGGMFAYKKLIAPSAGRASYVAEEVTPLPADGMMAQNAQPQPPAPAPAPVAQPAPAPVETPAPAAPVPPATSSPAKGMLASASSPAPAASAAAKAPDSPATVSDDGAKDAEIAKLKNEVAALRKTHLSKPVAAITRPASSSAPKKEKVEKPKSGSQDTVQLGYRIKQIVPGQAWVENEAGKVQIIAVGDSLAGSEVTKIDAENYRIITTAGVIK